MAVVGNAGGRWPSPPTPWSSRGLSSWPTLATQQALPSSRPTRPDALGVIDLGLARRGRTTSSAPSQPLVADPGVDACSSLYAPRSARRADEAVAALAVGRQAAPRCRSSRAPTARHGRRRPGPVPVFDAVERPRAPSAGSRAYAGVAALRARRRGRRCSTASRGRGRAASCRSTSTAAPSAAADDADGAWPCSTPSGSPIAAHRGGAPPSTRPLRGGRRRWATRWC